MKPHSPWRELGVHDARRVNSDGRFDFFWVVLENGMPGLMLRLATIPQPAPRLPKLRNLMASFRSAAGGTAFVLCLKEQNQAEIFETLCRDVVNAGEAGHDVADALTRCIQRTRRWHHLLRGGRSASLSVEEQRGLVGELAFLRELASDFGPETAIEAWTGPTGSSKDFELIGSCIEVKARRAAAKPFVIISSEDQLADVAGSRLFLQVVNVSSAVLPEGHSLHDHVRITSEYFQESSNAFDAWEEALYSTGYDPDSDYDDRRWQLGGAENYEVVEGFPRVASPVPLGVERVRYALSLEACLRFKYNSSLIEAIREGIEP